MKFFEKFNFESDLDNLILSKRQISNISATLIFIFMLVFILGYFCGKKNAAEQILDKATNESFEDKVNYSLFSMYSNSNSEEDVVLEEAANEPVEPAKAVTEEVTMSGPEKNIVGQVTKERNSPSYYAALIGFSTKKAADSFLAKVSNKGYPIKIKTMKSVTPKGKSVVWYQVITEQFSDKESLDKLVKQIEKNEHLSGSKIITV